MSVHENQIIDQYRSVVTDYSKTVDKVGIKADLTHNGIITKTQINNFIKSLDEGKLVFYLKNKSKSAQAKCFDLRALRNSGFTNLVMSDRKAKREPFSFPVVSAENTSGMNVQLESCIARGGSVCRFCLRKK